MPDEIIPGQDPTPEAAQEAAIEQETPRTFSAEEMKKVRAEAAGYRTRLREYEKREQERADAEKTEIEKATARATRAEAEHQAAILENARLKAAIEHNLSADDLDFLAGNTPEEIAEKAGRLAKRVGSASAPPPPDTKPRPMTTPANPGVDMLGAMEETKKEALNQFFGGKLRARRMTAQR